MGAGNRGWDMVWDPEVEMFRAENKGTGAPDHLPPTGEPNSYGYDADGNRLPYANHRPEYAEGQVEEVYKSAREQQIEDIVSGRLELPPLKEDQLWVRALDDAEGPNVYETPGGDRYRLVEWRPGEPRKGVWEMGHLPDKEYRRLRHQYLSGEITPEEF